MPKPILQSAIAAIAILALALVLNPSAERHRAKIKQAVAERNELAGMLGVGKLTALASTYHSVAVASYTTVNDRTVSVGAFGMVFVRE